MRCDWGMGLISLLCTQQVPDVPHALSPQVPDVRWDDVGGLEDVKSAILDTIELPLR